MPSRAHAEANAEDRAAAQSLFDQGRELVKHERCGEAIPKLEESERLDPSLGTALNLAVCYEKVGRTASAWSLYLDVAELAKSKREVERETYARQHASLLEPKLSRLTVSVAPAARAIPQLEVLRDNKPLGAGQWGSPIPVDVGEHRISARAPGYRSYEQTVSVTGSGSNAAVEVGALQLEPASPAVPVTTSAPTSAPEPLDTRSHKSSQRTIAVVVAAVGVVALGVGGALALRAKHKQSEALDGGHCVNGACDATGYAARADAVSLGNKATIVSIVGVGALGAGAILWFTAPKPVSTSAWSVRRLQVGIGSVALDGVW